MTITAKGRYGIRIMLDIAKEGKGGPVSISAISERQEISHKYAEQITRALVQGGLLRSLRGAQGGYELTRPPVQYTAGEILRCMEGELAPVVCVEGECGRASTCMPRALWEGLRLLTNAYFDGVTLADLLDPDFSPREKLASLDFSSETLDKRGGSVYNDTILKQ